MPPDPHVLRRKKLPICFVCKAEIQGNHYKCADCSVNVDLCVECLTCGLEAPEVGHVKTHRYHVLDNLGHFSLFGDAQWTAKDEIALLEGVEVYGMGNWRDIATYIGGKTDQQCSRHYMQVYLANGHGTAPLPGAMHLATVDSLAAGSVAPAAGANTGSSSAASGSSRLGVGPTAASRPLLGSGGVGTGAGSGAGGAGGGGVGAGGYSTSHVPRVDVSGYMPLRGDFDVEHDNEAEAVLADLDFTEGEHGTETELKLKILEIYNSKLDERERRKAFILERGLLDYKRLLSMERRRPKEEREVYNALRPFARFLSPAEWEDLVRGIVLEHRLRKRIAQLQEYRRAGITSLADAAEYEATKKRRAAEAAAKRKSAAVYMFETSLGLDPLAPFGLSASSSASASGVGAAPGLGRGSSSSSAAAAAAASSSSAAGRGGKRKRAPGAGPGSALAGASSAGEEGEGAGGAGGVHAAYPTSSPTEASGGEGGTPMPLGSPPASTASAVGTGAGGGGSGSGFSVATMVGANALSTSERTLCESLCLTPAQYSQIKSVLLNLSFVRGYAAVGEAKASLVHVDAAKVDGVYNFVVSAGMVKPQALAASSSPSSAAPSNSAGVGGDFSSGGPGVVESQGGSGLLAMGGGGPVRAGAGGARKR